MKTYSYKSPIINLIIALSSLFCSFIFIAVVFFSSLDDNFWMEIWMRICCGIFSLLFFSLGGVMGYIFTTNNINPKKIILEEDRILIPSQFSAKIEPAIFRYSEIKVLKIIKDHQPLFSPYGSAIYIATGETGYIREIYIEKIWMKNKSEYLELFEFLQDKTDDLQNIKSNIK